MTTGSALTSKWHMTRAVLWRDWIQLKDLIVCAGALWVLVILILPVLDEPMRLLSLIIMGQVAAVRLGGSDVRDGSESFAFTLPPQRQHYFGARYAMGLVVMLGFCLFGEWATRLGVSARFWSLFVESGLTESYIQPSFPPRLSFWVFPLALFGSYSATFGFASVMSRRHHNAAWIAGIAHWIGGPLIFFWLLDLSLKMQLLDRSVVWRTHALALMGCVFGILCVYVCELIYRRKRADSSGNVGYSLSRVAILVVAIFMLWHLYRLILTLYLR